MKKHTVNKLKKANLLLANFLEVVTLLFVCLLLIVSINNKDRLTEVFGFELNIIKSGSMSPYLIKYDFVVTYKEKAENIKEGDIIVFFDDSKNYKILHRVKEVVVEDEKIYFVTKGDNNMFADAGKRSLEDVYAKHAFKVPYLGLFFTFLSSSQGLAIIIVNASNLMFMSLVWESEEDKKKILSEQEFKNYKNKKLKKNKNIFLLFD